MKKLTALFAVILFIVSIAMANIKPTKVKEDVYNPETGKVYYQCINPGSDCAVPVSDHSSL
jgi:preprotein translocase subunit SecG